MKTLNKKEERELQEAFQALCNMYFATEKNNFSKCTSFHIKPFNPHWDEKTVQEVMKHVKMYLSAWVITPMEQVLKINKEQVEKDEQQRHKEALEERNNWLGKKEN